MVLRICNLTSMPLEVELIERYEAAAGNDHPLLNLTKNMTLLFSPPSQRFLEISSSFHQQDAPIPIAAFQTVAVDVAKSPTEALRLTFTCEAEQYRVYSAPASISVVPLVPSPKRQYTAIHRDEHLTFFSSANLASWMRELDDLTPLSALSIPGTHNSPTWYRALPSVRCQAVSPRVQLENGVRFFDVRVQLQQQELVLVHSVFPIALTGAKYFRDLVRVIVVFLTANPSETLIMSVKREGIGGSDAQLAALLRQYQDWFTEPRIPMLGEARGKIVLLRRFVEHGWGIDAETWADNTPCATCPSGHVCVQDFYEVLETINIGRKIEYAEAQLERAAQVCCAPGATKQPLMINFLSASNFWRFGCWPERIAARLNPAMVAYLCQKHAESNSTGDGSTGIVVCDWVGNNGDWDLVRCIVGMNARLEMRQKKGRWQADEAVAESRGES